MDNKSEKDKNFATKCWIGYFLISGALFYGLLLAAPKSWPWFAGIHLGLSGLYLALLAFFGAGSAIEMGLAVIILLVLALVLIPLLG